jgi:hypothetical protein
MCGLSRNLIPFKTLSNFLIFLFDEVYLESICWCCFFFYSISYFFSYKKIRLAERHSWRENVQNVQDWSLNVLHDVELQQTSLVLYIAHRLPPQHVSDTESVSVNRYETPHICWVPHGVQWLRVALIREPTGYEPLCPMI